MLGDQGVLVKRPPDLSALGPDLLDLPPTVGEVLSGLRPSGCHPLIRDDLSSRPSRLGSIPGRMFGEGVQGGSVRAAGSARLHQ